MTNLRNITDLPIVESVEDVNLIVNDNGIAKQVAASAILGNGGGVFVIDTTDDTYSETDTAYGNAIKDALLNGDRVFVYDGTGYTLVTGFSLYEDTYGTQKMSVYTSLNNYGSGYMVAQVMQYNFCVTF